MTLLVIGLNSPEPPEDFRGLAGFFSSDWKVIPVLPSSENQIFSVILKTSRGY